MNTNEPNDPRPTVADEVNVVIDDAEVIAKTLPANVKRASLKDQAHQALCVTRDSVVQHPIEAVLLAAAVGAALSAWVTARMLDHGYSDRATGGV